MNFKDFIYKHYETFQYNMLAIVVQISDNMRSLTILFVVFTLGFCLNLIAGKNLAYKGHQGTKYYLVEVEDTEDNNGYNGDNTEDTEDNNGNNGDNTK